MVRTIVLPVHFALLSLMASLPACGAASDMAVGNDPSVRRELVGNLSGTDARIGIVLQNGKVNFFVCGGPSTYTTHTKWLRGEAIDFDSFSLAADGWSASAARVGGRWAGKLRRPGDAADLPFDAYFADPFTIAGLYETTIPEGLAGVIVMQRTKADPATVQGSFKLAGGGFLQVLPVRTTRDAEGLLVKVAFAGGEKQFHVLQSQIR